VNGEQPPQFSGAAFGETPLAAMLSRVIRSWIQARERAEGIRALQGCTLEGVNQGSAHDRADIVDCAQVHDMLLAIGACLGQRFNSLVEVRNNLIEARSERLEIGGESTSTCTSKSPTEFTYSGTGARVAVKSQCTWHKKRSAHAVSSFSIRLMANRYSDRACDCFALTLALPLLAASQAVCAADAQVYPVRPIRLIVPSTAGSGGVDLYARLIGKKLTEAWGQQVIVDNRPGAGMALGAAIAAKAAPDGYTLVMGHPNSLTVGPALRAKSSYDPMNDFAPISLLMKAPSMLSVHPASAITSVQELIAAAKKRPGEVTYGTSGTGSVGNMIGELLSQRAAIRLVHVPYKGAAPALLDLGAGRLMFVSSSLVSQIGFVRDGRLRAIATTGAKRTRLTPSVPTVIESGIPGFDVTAWHGVLAPAKTPPAIIAQLNREIVRILGLPDVQETLLSEGGEITPTSPQEFAALIRSELRMWIKVVKQAGIALD
jgi:tripartite-type tricarboxylate transporter receptor subunit TctC